MSARADRLARAFAEANGAVVQRLEQATPEQWHRRTHDEGELQPIGGPDAPAWGWANLVRRLVPVMERLGVATAAEVDAATLADRLFADLESARGVVLGPPMIGS